MSKSDEIKRQILDLTLAYHEAAFEDALFVPGETAVPVSGKVFDADELINLVDSSLDFWLTTGRYANQFEQAFARYLGVRHASLCNSGSSANLLALSALTSPSLGSRQLQPGDEVITVAAGFPTTVNPILQNQLTPVFLDIDLKTHNIAVAHLEEAISPRTKAIMVAHTLGNPFDLDAVTAVAPFRVPSLIPHFLGRDAEMAQLGAELTRMDTRRVVALVGMGGIGKTALAIECAHVLRDAFPDGVLWANAATDDPMSIAERWANAYGYDFSRIPDLEERGVVLRDLLNEKQALVIFDDVDSAAKIRHFLPEGNRCAVLLTTRQADLAHVLQAQLVEVKELGVENGRSLLISLIGEERVLAEEAAAAEICHLLQGLPLAISIVGQRLALRPKRKLAAFAARLRHEAERLGLEDEHRALKASFAISWQGLSEVQREVFAYLAVFAGRDFSVPAMAAIAETGRYPTQDRLDELVALSLLNEDEEERYRQHSLLALFAQEKLGAADAPFQRMVAYYHDFAQENREDYAALGPEWENLSASIAQAHEMSLWSAALKLTETLQPAWFRRGRYHEARQAFSQAAAAAEALHDQPALARCLYYWGYVCWEQNDWNEAHEKLSQSYGIYQEMDDKKGMALAQIRLAWVTKDLLNYDEAERLMASSRRLSKEQNDESGIAETMYLQGTLYYHRGDYESAKITYEKALRIQGAIDDKLGVLRTLNALVQTLRRLNADVALQKEIVNRANNLAEELEDQVERSIVLREMFLIYWKEGNHQGALEFANKSLNLFRSLGDWRNQAMLYFLLSEYYEEQTEYKEGLVYVNKCLEICSALQDLPGSAYSLIRLGDIHVRLRQIGLACQAWQEAFEIAQQVPNNQLHDDLNMRLNNCSGKDNFEKEGDNN